METPKRKPIAQLGFSVRTCSSGSWQFRSTGTLGIRASSVPWTGFALAKACWCFFSDAIRDTQEENDRTEHPALPDRHILARVLSLHRRVQNGWLLPDSDRRRADPDTTGKLPNCRRFVIECGGFECLARV